MKKLFIIRHAKSDWNDSKVKDIDRPLNQRGLANAPFMGNILKIFEVIPDLILSSPANRALTTAKLLAKEIAYEKEIKVKKDIYESNFETIIDIIREINDKNKTVFIVGHNPELSDLADYFCKMNLIIPTCAIVEIDFNTNSWESISRDNASLVSYDYPKKYKES